MPFPDPNPELAAGLRLLDRYTIVDRVGSGGMASIYRANDERLERIVCVKLLRLVLEGSGSASGHGVYQASYTHFLAEALALSKLQHPNTLRIYDFGYTEDDRPFQISEFLDGGNLETLVRASGSLTVAETAGVLERICGAVAEAHEHGIIHRDIKPSNILFARIARGGEGPVDRGVVGHTLVPKLADFGIASSRLRRASDVDLPEDTGVSSVALFSPRWAAPEQLTSGLEGPATDVYALGLIAAYMLSGRVLFADVDVRAHFDDRVRGDEFARERLASLGLDDRVTRVLTRALAGDPEKRMPTPAVFYNEVNAALSAHSVRPPPMRRPYESITLVVEPPEEGRPEADAVAPAERSMTVGGRLVRIVEMQEKLDFTLHVPGARDIDLPRPVRFRAAFLPSPGPEGFALHIKGLSCFVQRAASSRAGAGPARPTPAITATESGDAELVSSERETLAVVAWSFGRGSGVGPEAGRVFELGAEELVVPFSQASQAVAIELGPTREAIVMCKRA